MPETRSTMSAYTDAQLHALACITCGRTDSDLQSSGHVRTDWGRSVTGRDPVTTAAGYEWDAVRIPLGVGMDLWMGLVAAPDTHERLGPVMVSDRSRATYWLVPTGSTDSWPDGCRLLTRGAWLLLPGPQVHPGWARWLHRPGTPGRLTGAVWLAAALNDHLGLEARR